MVEDKYSDAADHLLRAVDALCELGYGNIPEYAKRAANWANMARESLVKHDLKMPTCQLIVIDSKPIDAQGPRRKNQQVRIDKAYRARAKKLKRGANIAMY